MSKLSYPILKMVLMMTPDDGGNDGNTHASNFPARNEILDFCESLRNSKSIDKIKTLPRVTKRNYQVIFHKDGSFITNSNRFSYFSDFEANTHQVVFFDPDNGFEPEKSFSEKHVKYKEVLRILDKISDDSVISVFQHHRRKSFPQDFENISSKIEKGYCAAIYWHSLMFVLISKSKAVIDQIIEINKEYEETMPVKNVE